MATEVEFVKPVSGGGFGDCKVGIIQLSGTYATGGFGAGIKEEPIMMLASGTLGAVFDDGKIKLVDGSGEISADTDVSGVKVLVIIKGSF